MADTRERCCCCSVDTQNSLANELTQHVKAKYYQRAMCRRLYNSTFVFWLETPFGHTLQIAIYGIFPSACIIRTGVNSKTDQTKMIRTSRIEVEHTQCPCTFFIVGATHPHYRSTD
ncbi:hypothetical protein CRM22_001777 [Opisthorchis felineus]|uniref:Uncharacterized protein n=1 Tax=Opisthorchis felineus TaxID=147828 RepID=A0A4S2M916_OPIFE|nr:hypothetical protein CRM22_001777 [Opisthorchis felineus]